MPPCLVRTPYAADDTSFSSTDGLFFDTFTVLAPPRHEAPLFVPSPLTLLDDICDDNEVTAITYADDDLSTYRDAVTHSRAHHTLSDDCHVTASHISLSNDTDDCPSLISDSDDIFCTDDEDDVIRRWPSVLSSVLSQCC
jgi:hypothetical protein